MQLDKLHQNLLHLQLYTGMLCRKITALCWWHQSGSFKCSWKMLHSSDVFVSPICM